MHKEDFVQEDQISNASDDLTDGNFSAYFEDDPMGAGVSIYSVYHRFVRRCGMSFSAFVNLKKVLKKKGQLLALPFSALELPSVLDVF
ncbi:hypothetical protein CEXT_779091 [Caerostris extrusa]|uniref:Uncharacterized protein n=1 Tax=Caerostris extrusa TaxID=172846 RepID=A0AAV4NW96_CAEEX|nr:hypothetical protein CEXT_779091 [Caerostris extrusa]